MASDRTIQLARGLLGKRIGEEAKGLKDGVIAELVLMELEPRLKTEQWTEENLMGAFELLVHQAEIRKQKSDSFYNDDELFAKIHQQMISNCEKPLSSNKEQYAAK